MPELHIGFGIIENFKRRSKLKHIQKNLLMAMFLSFVIFTNVYAEDAAKEEDKGPWTGTGEIGFLMTGGNTETESLNSKLTADYAKAKWFNKTAFEAIYSTGEKEDADTGETDKEKSAEKYLGSNKTGYNITDDTYALLLGEYTYDLFSGYYYQTVGSIGIGHRLIKTERQILELEAGPGYRFSSIREPGDGDDGEEAIARFSGMYKLKLTEKSDFQQDLTVETGKDTTITKSVSAITAQIVGAMAMKASFTLRHDSSPPADTEKTDRQTALTLVYSF
jgi:putative salt-induced outer membrane protein YdiY